MDSNSIFDKEIEEYKTVVLANGEFPNTPFATRCLSLAERIICCDGAVEKLLSFGKEPNVIVGDCDSISSTLYQRFKKIIIEDKDCERNDLQKSLNYCKSKKYNHIVVLGACGLRGDHFLANLSILNMFSSDLDLAMVGNDGIFSFISEDRKFCSYPGQAVSIFSLEGDAYFSFHGLKYPVKNRPFKQLWEGSLNVADGDSFTIQIANGKGIVYRNFVVENKN